ncbi:MAG: hypothetical protein P4L85_11130 [Paludisphaera borealis]|uniref:hypothetical protein n=1 Tax=Paludisphaera borealis TaxID=1387353 RepID=UPI002841DB72|nr:hypothetical protein [Paludisphaera borealis]MDR3619892.1 hypothetical protein [Paludisphaera borealis]
MEDQTLADFQVMGKATTLDDAVDLGAIGSNIQTIPGYLDIRGGTGVALYKITLGTSQPLWRLGLQLDANRIGSTLQAALTLFDQQGRTLATSDYGEGLGAIVGDAYMFSALKPGVYYVGVSGIGNLGGQPGGYDPTTGEPGISSKSQVGGPFQLEVVADPVTSSTRVVGFSLQSADPASTAPTGFTITLSDSIDPKSLLGTPLYVQDEQGRLFPVFVSALGTQPNQAAFNFIQPLAPGDYRLVVPQEGGLTDLIGRKPVAANLPAGVLATWTIQATSAGPTGGDVGLPLGFTRLGDLQIVANGTAVLASGGDVTYRFFVPTRAVVRLTTETSMGAFRVRLVRADGAVITDPIADSSIGRHYQDLNAGVYLLTLSADGSEPVTIAWWLSIELNRDSFSGNAVGSAGALSLRMGGSGSVTPDAYGSPIGSVGPAPFSTVSGPVSISTLPSSFTVTVGSALVGRPSARNDAFSIVGPTVAGGLLALADSSRGLISGILPAAAYGDDGQIRSPDGLLVKKDTSEKLSNLAEPGTLDDELRRTDGEEQGVQADALALLEADRLAEAARSVSPWLFRGVEDGLEALANGNWLDSMVLARTEGGDGVPVEATRGDDEHSGQVERATLGVPISLVVAAVAAFRFRQLSRKWWRQSPSNAKPTKSPQPSLWRGPRFMVPPHSSRTSRSRTSHHV